MHAVQYKVACLVHQSLSGLAPAYLADWLKQSAVYLTTGHQQTGNIFVVEVEARTNSHTIILFWIN